MKKLFIITLALTVFSCSSRKKLTVEQSFGSLSETSLKSDLISYTRILDLMDVEFRQVEYIDSSGTRKIKTMIDLKKRTETSIKDTVKTVLQDETRQQGVIKEKQEVRKNNHFYILYISFLLVLIFMVVKRFF